MIFQEVMNFYPTLDVLLNNSVVQVASPLVDTTVEEWDAVMASNLSSVFLFVKLAHPLMNAGTFALMRSNAVLINTARGPIVHEKSLIEALQAHRLGGAALDVFEVEPLPVESPLMKMDNVMLAPHNSNSSPTAWERVHWNTIRNLLDGLSISATDLSERLNV